VFVFFVLMSKKGWVGGWIKSENKSELSPAGAEAWAELGNTNIDILTT
jgi:hypothetical protein